MFYVRYCLLVLGPPTEKKKLYVISCFCCIFPFHFVPPPENYPLIEIVFGMDDLHLKFAAISFPVENLFAGVGRVLVGMHTYHSKTFSNEIRSFYFPV